MSEFVSKKIDNKYEIILLNVVPLQKTTVTVALYMLLISNSIVGSSGSFSVTGFVPFIKSLNSGFS